MPTIKETFNAGETRRYNFLFRMFRLLSVTAPVDITLYDKESGQTETLYQVLGGIAIRGMFDYLEVKSAAAQEVHFICTMLDAYYDRDTINVSVVGGNSLNVHVTNASDIGGIPQWYSNLKIPLVWKKDASIPPVTNWILNPQSANQAGMTYSGIFGTPKTAAMLYIKFSSPSSSPSFRVVNSDTGTLYDFSKTVLGNDIYEGFAKVPDGVLKGCETPWNCGPTTRVYRADAFNIDTTIMELGYL